MQVPWYLLAMSAAVVWGIHYPLIDNALKRVSVVSVLVISALPALFLLPFFRKTVLQDCEVLRQMPWGERGAILALAATSLAGTALLFLSIGGKNATLASLIEISYPVFVALFAYLLFREFHINASVVLGALLVFAGVGIIIWNNP